MNEDLNTATYTSLKESTEWKKSKLFKRYRRHIHYEQLDIDLQFLCTYSDEPALAIYRMLKCKKLRRRNKETNRTLTYMGINIDNITYDNFKQLMKLIKRYCGRYVYMNDVYTSIISNMFNNMSFDQVLHDKYNIRCLYLSDVIKSSKWLLNHGYIITWDEINIVLELITRIIYNYSSVITCIDDITTLINFSKYLESKRLSFQQQLYLNECSNNSTSVN